MKFRQHFPSYATGFELRETEGSLDEILESELVKRFKEHPNFCAFVWSRDRWNPNPELPVFLMGEYENGKTWWVVGYLSEEPAGLARWAPPPEEKK